MNTTIYKSSQSLVFKSFAAMLIAPLALFAALFVANDAEKYMTILYSVFILVITLIAYFTFYRHNITIEVTDDTLKFLRLGKEYLNFNRETCEFTSLIVINRHNGIRTSTSRYLRVILKDGGKHKDYECYNFDKKTFEEFITTVSTSSQQTKTEYYKKPLTFTINKSLLLAEYRKYRLISFCVISATLLCLAAVALLPSLELSPKAYMFIILTPIIASIFSVMKFTQLSKVKSQTPEKVTISKDKLTVDNEDFYFSYITLIKMTPPSYERKAADIEQNPFRRMIITERHITREFILDFLPIRNNPISAFLEYGSLFNELKELFSGSENKFIAELE